MPQSSDTVLLPDGVTTVTAAIAELAAGGGAAALVLSPSLSEFTSGAYDQTVSFFAVLDGWEWTDPYTPTVALHEVRVDIPNVFVRTAIDIEVTGASGGSFDLTINGTTVAIPWNAAAGATHPASLPDVLELVKWLPGINGNIYVDTTSTAGRFALHFTTEFIPTVEVGIGTMTGAGPTVDAIVNQDAEGIDLVVVGHDETEADPFTTVELARFNIPNVYDGAAFNGRRLTELPLITYDLIKPVFLTRGGDSVLMQLSVAPAVGTTEVICCTLTPVVAA